jgi:hypothetical protein
MTGRLVLLAATAVLLTCAGAPTAIASASTTATAGGPTTTTSAAANLFTTLWAGHARAAQPPTFCSAYLDEWDSDVKCPPLAAGTYTFENTSPGDDGVQVAICFPVNECTPYALSAPGDSPRDAVVYSGFWGRDRGL